MTVKFDTKDLSSDCRLEDIKQFAADLCGELSQGFDGYSVPSVVIVLSQMLEIALANVEEETMENMMHKVESLSEEEVLHVTKILKGVRDGKEMQSAMDENLSNPSGEMMGYLSMVYLVNKLRQQLSEAKVVMASTAMSYSERANSLNELNDLLGLNLTSDAKHKIRNRLKGGTADPVDVKTGEDLSDLCDDLFG